MKSWKEFKAEINKRPPLVLDESFFEFEKYL